MDSLAYASPAATDNVDVCAWGSPEEIAVIQDLKELGGYTAFVEQGLDIVDDIGALDPIELPTTCRTPDGATVSSCTDLQVADDGYVRFALKVAPGSNPNCFGHSAGNDASRGYWGVQCYLSEGGFGNVNPQFDTSSYPCRPR